MTAPGLNFLQKRGDYAFSRSGPGFFLNKDPYYSGADNRRLGSSYKPWTKEMVQQFLERQCGLSRFAQIPGMIVESHQQVLKLWRRLIESGALQTPFDVIHVDAHPDLTIRGGLRLASGQLYFEEGEKDNLLKEEAIHAGNYLTYAVAYGWIASLTWIPIHLPGHDSVHEAVKPAASSAQSCVISIQPDKGVTFAVVQWQDYRATEPFDYVILSKSPGYTPRQSDKLVPLISQYLSNLTLQGS